MSTKPDEVVLRFEREAMERCYLTADILAEDFNLPFTEYALLGLAPSTDPLRVVATHLLPGQRVTMTSVNQPGRGVFAMRREIEALSEQQGRQLIPISFIHRHPGSCTASTIDTEFLFGPFLSQLSTVIRFDGLASESACCSATPEAAASPGDAPRPGNQSGLAFSLIVNRRREHKLYAATRTECQLCSGSDIRPLPARLDCEHSPPPSQEERASLRAGLSREIVAKVELPVAGLCGEAV